MEFITFIKGVEDWFDTEYYVELAVDTSPL